MHYALCFLLALVMTVKAHGQQTYTNPIVFADRSDPDACAVGGRFYMTASSFNLSPGLPIYESSDLVHWQLFGYALTHVPNADYTPAEPYPVKHGRAVWAPSIRHHEGMFYIYWGDPDFGIYMTQATAPRGPWSEPTLVVGGKGLIDPCPLWDESTGEVYLVNAYAASRANINSILVVRQLSADGKHAISQPRLVYDGTYDTPHFTHNSAPYARRAQTNHTVEGPKLYQRDGYYYIFAPAGGVASGWQLALRSRNIYGPYESRVVLEQGKSDVNGPHQGAWVEANDGKSWFLHFQEHQPYGRILHLQSMTWADGWPVMSVSKRATVPYSEHSATTENASGSTTTVSPFQWHANYEENFGMTTELGFQRIYSHFMQQGETNLWSVPNLWTQAFPSETFTATAKLHVVAKDEANRSGLLVMGWDYCHYAVELSAKQFNIVMVSCKDAEQGGEEQKQIVGTIPATRIVNTGNTDNYELDIYLRVHVDAGGRCTFAYSADGKQFYTTAPTFQAREGKWIGARVGLASITTAGPLGWVDCHDFTVEEK